MAAVTRELAAFTASIRFEALPAEVRDRTRFLVLDLVGNMLRGRHDARLMRSLERDDSAAARDETFLLNEQCDTGCDQNSGECSD